MTPEQLKASILQMAIQGKLVEQRPEEGTAEELYQKIQKELSLLVKEGGFKIKDDTPIEEDEIVFDIPDTWKWVRLGQIINIESGKGLTSKQMKKGDIPVYGGNGITGYHNKALVHKRTVVIGRVGFYCGSVHITEKDAWITDNAFITTYPEKSIDRDYLVYVLRFLNLGRGSNATAQPVVSGKKIYPMLFPLPPIKEQKRIVAKIEELLPYVDRYAASYEKLEQFNAKFPEDMKKSILQYAIQGKLVEQRPEEGTAEELYQQIQKEKQKLIKEGKIKKEKPLEEIKEDEIPFDIPESWKWVKVSDIATLENGDRSKKYPVESDYVEFGIPFFGAKDIVNGKMSFDGVRYISQKKYDELGNGKLVDKDLICLLRGSVGKTALFIADKKHKTGFICAQMLIIRAIKIELIPYLLRYFSSPLYQSLVDAKTTGTAVRQLPAKEIGDMIVPLPPLVEQKRIVSKVDELITMCERLV